jgi:hypothetical protein
MKRRSFLSLAGLAAASPAMRETTAGELAASPKGRAIEEPARTTPVAAEADVVVCGGGPAGAAAAIAAARSGAKALLLEAHGCLGGIWTAGLLAYLLDTTNKRGILGEILERIARVESQASGTPVRLATCCDPEIVKIVLERMCAEAKVGIQYHTRVCAAVVDRSKQNRLTHAIAESKSGREAFAGKVFIDCTGDGDLASLAGCRFQFGQPGTGLCQPMSMICLVTGLVPAEIAEYYREDSGDWAGPKDRLRQQMEKGGHSPSYAKPSLFRVRDDLFLLMANHEYGVKGTSANDVTAATLRARAELHNLMDGLRSLGGVWRNIRIVATAEQIGVREGRRIAGLYEITADDLREGRKHPDAVCQATFAIDVHALDPKKEKGIEKAGFRTKPYDIPLRALIAKDVRGLMMAGRCISGDFLAHSSYRVTGNAAAMGEAAGSVAAAAARAGQLPEEIRFPLRAS